MDLVKHYNSYRESVSRDALEGFADFAKKAPTADPARFPSVHSYLAYAKGHIQEAAHTGAYEDYVEWLTCHRDALVQVFERMVESIYPSGEHRTELVVLEYLHVRGHKEFKFSPQAISLHITLPGEDVATPITLIPRYSPKWQSLWERGHICIDADEFAMLRGRPGAEIVARKRANPCVKLFPKSSGYADFRFFNVDQVVDWTLPLFP